MESFRGKRKRSVLNRGGGGADITWNTYLDNDASGFVSKLYTVATFVDLLSTFPPALDEILFQFAFIKMHVVVIPNKIKSSLGSQERRQEKTSF